MRITRTTNANGTYRYEIDGQVAYKASKVLYTHASTYSVNDHAAGMTYPALFHKTENAANKATGYRNNGWIKTGVQTIEDGDAAATVAHHALAIANLAAVLMEQGRLRVSTRLSSGAITTTLDIARGNEATRAAGIALAHGHDRDIRAAFKTSVPPAIALVTDEAPARRPLRKGTKVQVNALYPTKKYVGARGKVQSTNRGDDGKTYVTVDFGTHTWPFLVTELDAI
jgi:hypothetical protein